MEYMNLIGSEDVKIAGQRMIHASQQMDNAACTIQMALTQHQNYLEEWIQRFEAVLRDSKG